MRVRMLVLRKNFVILGFFACAYQKLHQSALPTNRSACGISGKLEWKVAFRESGSLGFLRYRAENRPQRGELHKG
jgi:hypothetical protein